MRRLLNWFVNGSQVKKTTVSRRLPKRVRLEMEWLEQREVLSTLPTAAPLGSLTAQAKVAKAKHPVVTPAPSHNSDQLTHMGSLDIGNTHGDQLTHMGSLDIGNTHGDQLTHMGSIDVRHD